MRWDSGLCLGLHSGERVREAPKGIFLTLIAGANACGVTRFILLRSTTPSQLSFSPIPLSKMEQPLGWQMKGQCEVLVRESK